MQEQTPSPKTQQPHQTILSQALQIGSQTQPFSQESHQKSPRTRDAKITHSVCPYCAVGCSLNIYTKNGQVLDIEGDPDSPINQGTLCPKGSATFQYTINPSRLTQVL